MFLNLFSIFDPLSSTFNYNLNWLSTILGLLLFPKLFWMIMSRINILWWKLIYQIDKEIKILTNNSNKSITLLFTSMLLFILFNNFLGMFPYIFTSSSHLTMSLTLSLPLWLSFMLFGWINNTNHMFTHLVPQNTPNILMPFMVMIETISNLIRSMTLAIRLTANMIAGHLLLTLMSGMGDKLTIYGSFILINIQIFLLTLEFAVSIIQSYVFMVLSTLYSSEVN